MLLIYCKLFMRFRTFEMSYAYCLCLKVVMQVRAKLGNLVFADFLGIRALQQLVVEADASSMAYHDVGAATTAIRQGKEPYQLPPADPSRRELLRHLDYSLTLPVMWEDITVGLQTSITGTHEERFETASSSDIPFSVAQRLRNPLR